jgi:general secretion pathway protein D
MSEVAVGVASEFGPITTQRKARTTVFAHDRQPIIIGGLMRDKVVDSAEKVPLLGDIPLLGVLFRSTKKTVEKQNIIIALTPHVIEGPRDLARVLESKLRERREFLRHFGTEEEQRLAGGASSPGMLERINRAVKEADEKELARHAAAIAPVEVDPLPL